MSKKELKIQHPDLNYNIIDVVSKIHPEGSSKYLPLLIKEFKRKNTEWTKTYFDDFQYYIERIKDNLKFRDEELSKLGYVDIKMLYEISTLLNNIVETEVLERHHEHHVNNRLENSDISTYKTIKDLINEVKKADFKSISNEQRKFIHVVFEDDKWLVIKPMTFESSLKYGASTKWCTASKNNPYHFYRYTKNGNLYYVMNKKEIYKCAFYFEKSESIENNISFQLYNEEDERIDTSMLNIDRDVIMLIIEDSKKYKSNYQFISETYPEIIPLLEKLNNDIDGPMAVMGHPEIPHRVHDYYETMEEPEGIMEEPEGIMGEPEGIMGEPMNTEFLLSAPNRETNIDVPTNMNSETFYPERLQREYETINDEIYEKRLSILEKQLKHSLNTSWFSRMKRKIFGSKLIFVGLPKNMVPEHREHDILSKLHNTVLEWDIKYRCVFYLSSENNLVINKV